MISKEECRHHYYLNNLVNRLSLVGENPKKITSIIVEPTWIVKGNPHELCDLILLHNDFTASAVELKGSMKRREKAIHQILSGKEYITDILRYDFNHGLFVIYDNGRYSWERINV